MQTQYLQQKSFYSRYVKIWFIAILELKKDFSPEYFLQEGLLFLALAKDNPKITLFEVEEIAQGLRQAAKADEQPSGKE